MVLKKQDGFTLIELLIVIVIIGILAGVLIGVIDPQAQQNRARDAGIIAAINKVALATEGYISAYGAAPDEVQFYGQFKSDIVSDPGADCELVGGNECKFAVQANALPDTCPTLGWYGESASGDQCYFRYFADSIVNGQFTLYAKSAGMTSRIFKYQNFGGDAGKIMNCNATDLAGCVE